MVLGMWIQDDTITGNYQFSDFSPTWEWGATVCASTSPLRWIDTHLFNINMLIKLTSENLWKVQGTRAKPLIGIWDYIIRIMVFSGGPGKDSPCNEGMATLFSILAWRIPWTEEPGGLQSMESQRVRHDWANFTQTVRVIARVICFPELLL